MKRFCKIQCDFVVSTWMDMICFGNEKIMEKLRNRCLIVINLVFFFFFLGGGFVEVWFLFVE